MSEMEWVRRTRGEWELVFGDREVVDEAFAWLSEGFGSTFTLTFGADGAVIRKIHGIWSMDRAAGIVDWEFAKEGLWVE